MKSSKLRRLANLNIRSKEDKRRRHLSYSHNHKPIEIDPIFILIPTQLACLGISTLKLENY